MKYLYIYKNIYFLHFRNFFLSAVKIRPAIRINCNAHLHKHPRIASTHSKTHWRTQLTHSRQYICASKFSSATKALSDLILVIEFSLISTHANTTCKHWHTTNSKYSFQRIFKKIFPIRFDFLYVVYSIIFNSLLIFCAQNYCGACITNSERLSSTTSDSELNCFRTEPSDQAIAVNKIQNSATSLFLSFSFALSCVFQLKVVRRNTELQNIHIRMRYFRAEPQTNTNALC